MSDPCTGQAFYDRLMETLIDMRGIRGRVCQACNGWGVQTYANTSTWRHGIGGNALTPGVCDRCWGSGDADRPWPSHRILTAKETP